MLLKRATFETPVGPMLALASPTGLCALEFDAARRHERLEARLARWFAPCTIEDVEACGANPEADRRAADGVLQVTRRWLTAYFDGPATAPARAPFDMRGTAFELAVWRALLDVPYGVTASYGAIARRIGRPAASRAVGLANGANPMAIIVPCHRIIGTNGALTGYGGGLDRKQWLLRHEAPEPTSSLF